MQKDQLQKDWPARRWLADSWAHHATEFSMMIEGARIKCRGWQLDRTDLPGALLVHGFRAHARWWDHVAPNLCGTHRVVALDLSGMGDSASRLEYSRAQHGREVLGVAETLGMVRPTVIAHSYGGIASLAACRAAPDRVGRAIIIDSALPSEEDGEHTIPTPPARQYSRREHALSRFRLIPTGGWPDPEILAYVAYHSVRETLGDWSWKFDDRMAASLNQDWNYRASLLGTPVPCDFIYGELSEVVTPARLAQIPLMMPQCGHPIIIPASHHHALIEQPLALIAALRALLANEKLPAGASAIRSSG